MWKPLKEGDIVDIVAPANAITWERLQQSIDFLKQWKLIPRASPDVVGTDLLYANSDTKRFEDLERGLYAEDSKAVWCIRGGSGSTRLIPRLMHLPPPLAEKIFIGFSDITCLHLFAQQQWNWSPIHGPVLSQVAEGTISKQSIENTHQLIFGEDIPLRLSLKPLNQAAERNLNWQGVCTGGNLSLIQYGIGTPWQMNATNKIIILEEVNERPYRVMEQMEQLRQVGIFHHCTALIFGQFMVPQEKPEEIDLMPKVLQRFAEEMNIPVLSCDSIGHGKVNTPVPMNTPCELNLGSNQQLQWNPLS